MDPEPGFSEASLTNLLIVDIATAQSLLNAPGQLSRIDLILNEDGRAAQLEKLDRVLPSGARIEPASTRSSTLDQMTQAFSLNLTAMSLLAMVVGMFLIYNTMTFSVVQRRSLIGRLRGIGVTAREISGLILAEAAVVGLIGSTIGMVSGIFLGHVLVDLVTRSINDLYFTVRIQELNLSWLGLGKGLLVGMGATVLAAFAPAREATRAIPSTVLRRSEDETRIETHGDCFAASDSFWRFWELSYSGCLVAALRSAMWESCSSYWQRHCGFLLCKHRKPCFTPANGTFFWHRWPDGGFRNPPFPKSLGGCYCRPDGRGSCYLGCRDHGRLFPDNRRHVAPLFAGGRHLRFSTRNGISTQ